jgi:hypothetical protein
VVQCCSGAVAVVQVAVVQWFKRQWCSGRVAAVKWQWFKRQWQWFSGAVAVVGRVTEWQWISGRYRVAVVQVAVVQWLAEWQSGSGSVAVVQWQGNSGWQSGRVHMSVTVGCGSEDV